MERERGSTRKEEKQKNKLGPSFSPTSTSSPFPFFARLARAAINCSTHVGGLPDPNAPAVCLLDRGGRGIGCLAIAACFGGIFPFLCGGKAAYNINSPPPRPRPPTHELCISQQKHTHYQSRLFAHQQGVNAQRRPPNTPRIRACGVCPCMISLPAPPPPPPLPPQIVPSKKPPRARTHASALLTPLFSFSSPTTATAQTLEPRFGGAE